MGNDVYSVGDRVEVNIAGLRPVTVTDVLVDLEEHDDWHPAEIVEVLPDGRYEVLVMPLIGAIEIPPVDATRLRRR
jgi:protein involved in polysaccharide export with SLBB domain